MSLWKVLSRILKGRASSDNSTFSRQKSGDRTVSSISQKSNAPQSGPMLTTQPPTHQIYTFTGSRFFLDLRHLYANVSVLPHTHTSQLEVEIDGAADLLRQIQVKQDRFTICISGNESSGGQERRHISVGGNDVVITDDGGVIVRSGGSISVTRGGGYGVTSVNGITVTRTPNGVYVNGQRISGGNTSNVAGDRDPASITVKAPRGTALYVQGVSGDLEVGDVSGIIDLILDGSGYTDIGSTTGGRVSLLGGDCVIGYVSGESLDVSIKGSGDVQVRSGNVRVFNGSVMGSGDIQCDQLVAENASLSIMGSGDIYVHRVTNQLSRRVVGAGDICIGNR